MQNRIANLREVQIILIYIHINQSLSILVSRSVACWPAGLSVAGTIPTKTASAVGEVDIASTRRPPWPRIDFSAHFQERIGAQNYPQPYLPCGVAHGHSRLTTLTPDQQKPQLIPLNLICIICARMLEKIYALLDLFTCLVSILGTYTYLFRFFLFL